MKKLLATLAAAIGIAAGASAATFDLATVTKNTSFPNGTVLTGTHGGGCKLLIADGATVTLSDAIIKRTSNGGQYAGITCEGDATIELVGDNEVTGYHFDHPAIYVPQGKTLTIKGPGTLNAATLSTYNSRSGWDAGYAAAIGGGVGKPCGNIVIESGIVNANAGFWGAGIGAGANGGTCGSITIKGGRISAMGGVGLSGNDAKWYGGAGIGGANKGNCGAITIQDGVVTATGGYDATGIGAGSNGSGCGSITISGGTIKASGYGTAPGIGASSSTCGNILFSGGTIIAKGGDGAPGIGSGANGVCGTVYIGSGIKGLTAIRGKVSHSVGVTAPIGAGASGTCGTFDYASMPNMQGDGRMWVFKLFDLSTLVQNITVYNGMTLTGSLADSYKVDIAPGATVTLQDARISMTDDGTFPGINCLGAATLTLKGLNVVRGHGASYPGIYVPSGKTLTIEGDGSLMAYSNGKATGIGGGTAAEVKSCGSIVIDGGTIRAIGGEDSTAIGGVRNSACGTITIGSGIRSISATGGAGMAYAIGAGNGGTGGVVTLAAGLIQQDMSDTETDKETTIISAALRNLGGITSNTTFMDGAVLTGTLNGNTQRVKLTIADGATVTLSDANIIGINTNTCKWAGLTCLGDATIILEGKNTVKGFYKIHPGIHVPSGKTLTILGSGSLDASSNGKGAGIGGGADIDCGNIVIEGGSITATGGGSSAGIGTGDAYAWGGDPGHSVCGDISILGGMVVATGGGGNSSGIGTGRRGICGDITIGGNVDSVVATGGGLSGSQPIGKSGKYATCGTITVAEGLSDTTEGNTRTIRGGDLSKLTGNTVFGDGVTLKGTLAGNYKVSIADGATVTLRDVSILGWDNYQYPWAGLTCEGDATIILKGENKVRGFYAYYPGIHVPEGKTLTIKGSGSLDVRSSGHAAGIGGGRDLSCGNIDIEGGTITAEGGSGSAGIGSGVSLYESVSCGDITLSGGTITATGGSGGSGIGTGDGTSVSAECGTITLSGATVTATGGSGASGIGAGDHGKCAGIVITGGAVTANAATTGTSAPGIGSGERGEVGGIDITGGIVFANATPGAMTIAPGIGSGASGSCGNINIGGYVVSVVATRGEHSMLTDCIGKAVNGSCGTVWVDPSLSDVTIGLTRTIQQADLEEIVDDTTFYDGTVIHGMLPVWSTYKLSIADGATVTLRDVMINGIDDPSYKWAGLTCLGDATIILEGENSVGGFEGKYPGIFVPEGKTLTIKGDGELHAWSNGYGAGIGGGNSPGSSDLRGGNIVIEGGKIIATGGAGAAGIGGAEYSKCGNISITGGDVTAMGGKYAPGIGGGDSSSCGTITIGASVVCVSATKGEGAPECIGKGDSGSCGAVTFAKGLGQTLVDNGATQIVAPLVTVKFDAAGGTGGWTKSLAFASKLKPPTVTRVGYTFKSWSPAVPETVPAANVTYTAQWTKTKYTVKFDAAGGTGGKSAKQEYLSAIVAPEVTRSGYVFTGWSPNLSKLVPASDVTYTAQWAKPSSVTWKTKNVTGGVLLDKCYAPYGAITIPATVNGKAVVELGNYLFWNEKGVSSVTIPASVKKVGVKAFKGCEALTKVSFKGNLDSLGQAAFQDCQSLTEVTVPKLGDNYLWSSTFEGCTGLKKVSLPDGITSFGTSIFANCISLTDVNIPETVKKIKSFAFFSCERLADIWLPDALTTIEQKAFKNCTALESIDLPDLTTLGKAAFFNSGLVDVFVPGTIAKVDDYCFQKCAKLQKVTLEAGIVETGASVWANDAALKEVEFPATLETLGAFAFYRCAKFKTLTGFSSLASLKIVSEKAFKYCTSLKTLAMPSQVTSIPKEMCNYCSALEKVTGTKNVKSFGTSAFSNCPALKSVAGLSSTELATVKKGKALTK